MNLGFDVKLAQEQKLIMTMEMQQSIKLLQMSNYELITHINNEIENNIALDSEYIRAEGYKYEENDKLKEYIKAIEYIEGEGFENRTYFQGNESQEATPFNYISSKESFKETLLKQLTEQKLSKKVKNICIYIIENLDERGYLDQIILEEISEVFKIEKAIGEKCIGIVQELEPVGVGARSIEECLILQLHKENIWDNILESLIKYYLKELSEGKYKMIGDYLNILPSKVQEYEKIIKTLNPKPSRGFFTGEVIGYIIPDLYIKKEAGAFEIVMNDSILPRLSINKTYKEIIEHNMDKEAVGYIKEKLEGALFLIKSIQNRKNTMQKVMEEIIKYQKDYFEGRDKVLKPMTIKAIASSISLHESTVSRAVRDKYVAMHTGRIISMRSFFTSAVNDINEDISPQTVRNLIKSIVDSENKTKPLSDSFICMKLEESNIYISRRTVAKYREECGIKSSTQRKSFV